MSSLLLNEDIKLRNKSTNLYWRVSIHCKSMRSLAWLKPSPVNILCSLHCALKTFPCKYIVQLKLSSVNIVYS